MIYKHGLTWTFVRALGGKYRQINMIGQGTASGCGLMDLFAQKPEHERKEATGTVEDCVSGPDSELTLRWRDDLIR